MDHRFVYGKEEMNAATLAWANAIGAIFTRFNHSLRFLADRLADDLKLHEADLGRKALRSLIMSWAEPVKNLFAEVSASLNAANAVKASYSRKATEKAPALNVDRTFDLSAIEWDEDLYLRMRNIFDSARVRERHEPVTDVSAAFSEWIVPDDVAATA